MKTATVRILRGQAKRLKRDETPVVEIELDDDERVMSCKLIQLSSFKDRKTVDWSYELIIVKEPRRSPRPRRLRPGARRSSAIPSGWRATTPTWEISNDRSALCHTSLAKEAGQFSRRHETAEANALARIRYQERHGKDARQRRAAAREFHNKQEVQNET